MRYGALLRHGFDAYRMNRFLSEEVDHFDRLLYAVDIAPVHDGRHSGDGRLTANDS